MEKSLKEVGSYRFYEGDELGRGNYGKVYKGTNTADGTKVAVKQIPKSIFTNQKLTELVIREITIAKSLQHPNIVKCLDAIQTSNNLYIITEYCDGVSLEKYLSDKKKLPEAEALKYFKQVVDAYMTLYDNKVIHRDLKPANLLFHGDQIKVCDLGFAKVINEEQNNTNTILGTPLYMSPELLTGDDYTSKCDMWALGFIIYQMLYGNTPWTGVSQMNLYNNINSHNLKFPEMPKVSQQTKELIKKMLVPTEEGRISWPELFNHPLIVKDSESSSVSEKTNVDNTTLKTSSPKIKIIGSS